MKSEELFDWLVDEALSKEIEAITQITVALEIDNITEVDREDGERTCDWNRLLLAASILAKSQTRKHQEAALRIATAAISLSTEIEVRDAGAVLLEKLSNHRAAKLAEDRELVKANRNERLGFSMRLEALRREMEDSVLVETDGSWLTVNDFQQKLWSGATTEDTWVSASAQTASGKTFLILQWLNNYVRTSENRVAVYLAPTRALVTEIESELKTLLKDTENVSVHSILDEQDKKDQELLDLADLARKAVHRDYQLAPLVERGVPSESVDAYDRFVTIMERVNANVVPVFLPPGLIPLHSLIVVEWLKGYSLAAIIRNRIDYQKRNGRSYRLPNLIRETLEIVEQTARFKAPKYLSSYVDVLNYHLVEIERSDLIDEEFDIGVALEFGVSSKTLLSLMELGLSRMTAVELYEKIAQDDLDRDGCLSWIRRYSPEFEGMNIPNLIAKEVLEKVPLEDPSRS
ncbi:DEAD/DEAH box helicase [Aurantiacibacter zhengii]|uniref:DEAD/DEAH-box helicase domain-containing protein n=1 Tax=Aurantiacibacter zhengii TaxID=2307003 RepID=A0A418NS94_9SPHN|nr:DEAD/DEAH box helicase [Aurantiacibacter zhengii]RIV85960.1 hypothetical protein D2V07_11720 [Aurantiacibacter zhengii]